MDSKIFNSSIPINQQQSANLKDISNNVFDLNEFKQWRYIIIEPVIGMINQDIANIKSSEEIKHKNVNIEIEELKTKNINLEGEIEKLQKKNKKLIEKMDLITNILNTLIDDYNKRKNENISRREI